MVRSPILPVLLALCLAAAPAAASPAAGTPLFQYGDDFGMGGGGGGGGSARDLNVRLSAYFTAIPMFSTEFYEESTPGADAMTWTETWQGGLGGGLEIAYHIAPGFRFGFGSGYWVFPGKEDHSGSTSIEWGDMAVIPFDLQLVFCFPFDLPSTSWFKGGRGFVEGPMPYIVIDIAGLYRPEVSAEGHWGSITFEYDVFDACFTFGVGARAGFEYRTGTFGIFADFGFLYFTAPKEGDDLGEDPLDMYGWPVRFGLAVYFGGTSGGGGGGGY
ncbi:MAG: hypothetical protein MUC63_02090 [Planctomycetes bacterium]|jgi:hypothetical protein|nr:hypothetical protein [Planctomycetota bacterium]